MKLQRVKIVLAFCLLVIVQEHHLLESRIDRAMFRGGVEDLLNPDHRHLVLERDQLCRAQELAQWPAPALSL